MDEDAGIIFMLLFWATLALAAFQRLWTIRRLRNKVQRLELDNARASAAPAPLVPTPIEQCELRRIQERLQVLERIAVEKEDTLSRQIEELRVASR